MQRPKKKLVSELLIPLMLFASISIGGVHLGRSADRAAVQSFEGGLQRLGDLAGGRLEQHVLQQKRTIDFVADELLQREFDLGSEFQGPGSSEGDFQRIGGSIAKWLPGFQAINWINVEGEIVLVSPRVGNQGALGKNLNQHGIPGVRAAFQAALADAGNKSFSVHFTPLIELYQGGMGYASYRAVVDREGSLRGVLNASFQTQVLIGEWLPESGHSEHISLAIYGPDDRLLFAKGDEATSDDWGHTSDLLLDILDEPWRLRVGPTREWLASELKLRGGVTAGLGVLFGLLVAGLYFSFARKRNQKDEADLRLGLALEGARLGVWDLDVASGSLFLNHRWLAMLGYRSSEIDFDLDFYRGLVHPDDSHGVETAMVRHLAGEADVYRTEHRLRAQSGRWIWVLDVGRIVERDHTGKPIRVVGTQTDLTEIHQAKQDLERSVGRYHSIFEHLPIGMLEQDLSAVSQRLEFLRKDGLEDLEAFFREDPDAVREFENLPVTLDMNPALLKLFRATSFAECRENVQRMIDGGGRHAIARLLVELFNGAATCETDFMLRDLDDQRMLYSIRLTVAPGCEADLSSVFISIVDNTRMLREEEQRRNQEAVDRQVQKDESLALLAGGVAHDFNNLLVPIIGNIELALQSTGSDDSVTGNLRRAEQASQRAADLARQMLTYSGRGQVQNEVFDVNALVREMSDLLSASLPGKVGLNTDLHGAVIGIIGDPTQLRQLVMNLVINAADATSKGAGQVVARTSIEVPSAAELEGAFLGEGLVGKRCAVIEVMDSGEGVDEETRKRMFEPFFSTKSAGRGLGMSVVLGIVRGHGGGLTVRGRTDGFAGTRIRVFLPSCELVSDVAASPDEVNLNEAPKALTGKVLFVDDESQVRSFAEEALGRQGLEVVSAGDGEQALELWDDGKAGFDLVILDATMPRLGGVETMERMRAIAPNLPIILASGYTQHGIATRAAEMNLVWFLPKPFGISELAVLVGQALHVGCEDTSGRLAGDLKA